MMTTVTIMSSDNVRFEMSEAAASLSRTLRSAIENGSAAGGGTPLMSKVPSKVLAKVVEYCTKHAAAAGGSSSAGVAAEGGSEAAGGGAVAVSAGASSEELKSFDEALLVDVDNYMVYDLLLAAYFLEVLGLVDLACRKVADMFKDKTVEDVRKMLQMKDDSTPEEDEANGLSCVV